MKVSGYRADISFGQGPDKLLHCSSTEFNVDI